MILLVAGLLVFLGMHSVSIFAEGLRDRMAARSRLGWMAVYGAVSLVGLILIMRGYAAARLDPYPLYAPPTWTAHLAALLMLPVFGLFIAPYLPGRIRTVARHPQLIAVVLWAGAHLLANGNLADVVLFGAFLIWAVADLLSMGRRTQRPLPGAPPSSLNDVLVVVVGLMLYGAFAFWAHQAWIGVAPFTP